MKKHRLFAFVSVLFIALLVGSLVAAPDAYAKGPKPPKPPAPPKPLLYKAKLVAVDVATAYEGMGMYQVNKKGDVDFKVSVEGFVAGEVLTVVLNGTEVGQITANATGEGQLRLWSFKGQTPPTVTVGMALEVQLAGVPVLTGTFAGK